MNKKYYDETDDIRDYWQRRHETWAENPVWSTYPAKQAWFRERFDHLLSPIMKGDSGFIVRGSVLDWGCGCGLYAVPLKERFADYLGFDTSIAAIQLANLYHQGVQGQYNFKLYSGEPGKFLDGESVKFDLIISITVLQHQPIPFRLAMIENIKRLLKPTGGYIGLEWSDASTQAFDMPPLAREDWLAAWLPLKLVEDLPPDKPKWHGDHVWYSV